MFYLSFHGGSGSNSLNNIHVYNDDGSKASSLKLLPQGSPDLSELRGFAFVNGLMVVNGYKKYSQFLQYTLSGTPPAYRYSQTLGESGYQFSGSPFDFTFDDKGHCYLSSQDTGVVTILSAPGKPGTIPSALTQNGVPGTLYLQGTFVAAASKRSSRHPDERERRRSPAAWIGVDVESGKMSNSVRGLAYWNGALLVADTVAGMVKAYSVANGSLMAAVTGLDSPVHLLIRATTLYVSTKQGVMKVALPAQISFTTPMSASPYITAKMMSHAGVESVAGMCFGRKPSLGAQTLFVVDRTGNAVYYLSGSSLTPFLQKLSDSPEFIVYQA
jgi:hypothetical protein